MKENQILFNGDMVRAFLEGRKTQTRRICKPLIGATAVADVYHRPDGLFIGTHLKVGLGCGITEPFRCPIGSPGDRLWVREAWTSGYQDGCFGTIFRADKTFALGKRKHEKGPHFHAKEIGPHIRWRPSIHMPRWASRITLEITEVRVQRLQEISEEDARAEGSVSRLYSQQDVDDVLISDASPNIKELAKILGHGRVPARADFARTWEEIYHNWDANQWVWEISFKRVQL